MMNITHSHGTSRFHVAAMAVAAAALVLSAAPPAGAAGLTNCVDLIGRSGACYESVWADGAELRMTFAQAGKTFPGATHGDRVANFYVTAPQTGTPQGALPFPHDHVVGAAPAHNGGSYRVHLHGFFVLCTAQGIATGGCVANMTSTPLGDLPLAEIVGGQKLTSVDAVESPANADLVTLIDTGAVLIGAFNPGK